MARRGPLGALALLLASGCVLSTPPGEGGGGGDGVTVVPTATGPGLPQGAPATATIGPDGGAVDGPGGAVRLTVPAGSVASATAFTVTPISSRATGALGSSWRIEATGPLAGPVQLTFRGLGSYRTGQDVRSLTIRSQDARGFWVAPAAVTHDPVHDTVTATTSHLSDWALVLAAAPALEGTFTLVQTVGVPFEATGTAALYGWQDAGEPTYFLTGTITAPSPLTSGALTCLPDATTQDLVLSVAEVHAAVFRWGLNARWALACTEGGSGATSAPDLATMFDTMGINLGRCAGRYLGTQVNGPDFIQGSYTSDCGVEGQVTASWDFRACTPGGACLPAEPCRVGTVSCTQGVGSCAPVGNAADDTACTRPTGTAGTCLAGACQ